MTASRMAIATHMSEGWVAMQNSLVPRTACPRLNPSSASLARTPLSSVAGRLDIAKVRTARALHDVAGHCRHVAQLRGRAREERLRQHREPIADHRVPGELTVANVCADAHSLVADVNR